MKAWRDSRVSGRLGLHRPIIQGPFGGGLSSARLTAAVSEAGGLGSFGVHHLGGEEILSIAHDIRSKTGRPFALNLWLPHQGSECPQVDDSEWVHYQSNLAEFFEELGLPLPERPRRFIPPFQEQLDALLEARPAAFSFVFGVPSAEILDQCRARNIVSIGTATTQAEAVALERAGVEMIVATGFEAGGHRVSFLEEPEDCLTGTMALIPQVVDSVDVPVIAAGGIADGRGIRAALTLGAEAVQVGTAFLACEESNAPEIHRRMLLDGNPKTTALTRAFSGRLARGLVNGLLRHFSEKALHPAPYPIQGWLTSELKAKAVSEGRADLLSLWAGQAFPLLRHGRARELFDSLVEQVEAGLTET